MAMLASSLISATSTCLSSRRLPNRRCWSQWRPSLVVTCSARTGKARASRKLMSDADLCKGLREFVSSVGFPEGHVPTTKELTELGRKDLANIVRRRGYRIVKELLANCTEVANSSDIECCLTEEQNLVHHFVDNTTGRDKKVNDLTEDTLDSVEEVSSSVNRFKWKIGSDTQLDDSTGMPIGSLNGPALQEKVEKSLKCGSLDLDRFEDNISHNLRVNDAEGSQEYKENSTGSSSAIHDRRGSRSVTRESKDTLMLNGTAVTSRPIAKLAPIRNKMRDNDVSLDAAFGQEINLDETENQDEIERLKYMLQRKDLELSQLKELIKKEKEALSTLQREAEDEINKAQKLISKMHAELLAAEDSLAGLKEVQIQYLGEGEVVEVAGSFNGWHQQIKMDPHPATGEDPMKSRNSGLWHTSLWLYPGEYEIKFVVDGEWKVDPEREITARSGMQNNMLRVDG